MSFFDQIKIGQKYSRKQLVYLWGYQKDDAIQSGIFTPKDSRYIILFVTKEKQKQQTQYHDYIDNYKLYCDGQNQHRTDKRIINSKLNNDEIHLFYRDHHSLDFEYFGEIYLIQYTIGITEPSKFTFHILSKDNINIEVPVNLKEFENLEITEKESIINSRIGQGVFRNDLIKLWKGCSVTGISFFDLLKASHIKP